MPLTAHHSIIWSSDGGFITLRNAASQEIVLVGSYRWKVTQNVIKNYNGEVLHFKKGRSAILQYNVSEAICVSLTNYLIFKT